MSAACRGSDETKLSCARSRSYGVSDEMLAAPTQTIAQIATPTALSADFPVMQ